MAKLKCTTHKRHPIACLQRQAIGCLLWIFWKYVPYYYKYIMVYSWLETSICLAQIICSCPNSYEVSHPGDADEMYVVREICILWYFWHAKNSCPEKIQCDAIITSFYHTWRLVIGCFFFWVSSFIFALALQLLHCLLYDDNCLCYKETNCSKHCKDCWSSVQIFCVCELNQRSFQVPLVGN